MYTPVNGSTAVPDMMVLNKKNITVVVVEFLAKASLNNVALKKPATQSNIGFNGHASRAVDGKASKHWNADSCTYSDGKRPWWMVDLEAVYLIVDVVITNREVDVSEVDTYSKWHSDWNLDGNKILF